MFSRPLSDTLALYILNQRAILDALSAWAKGQSNQPLDGQLWNVLRKHAGVIHSEHSLDHTQTLLEDFRRSGNQANVRRERQSGQLLQDALQHLVGAHFEWRHNTPLIRYDRVLQVQSWLAECNPDPLQCYLWAVDCTQEKTITSARDPFPTNTKYY